MMDTEDPKEEGELEDGEISSDEETVPQIQNSEEAGDYVLNERPTSWTAKLKAQSSSAGDRQYQPPLRPTRPEPPTYDDDDDNSSSSSEDSDEESGPMGKKTRRMISDPSSSSSTNFKAPASRKQEGGFASWSSSNPFDSSASSAERNAAFRDQATMFQQKRKTNNIWSTVLQEEEVSDIFGKVHVQEANARDVLIDRGPESFSIKYNQRTPVRRNSDSSSVSSGGLSDNEFEFLKGQLPDNSAEVKADVVVESDDVLPEKFGSRPRKRRRNPLQRSKKQMKKKMVKKMKKMKPEYLGRYMAEKLEEPKYNLLIKAVTMIGKEPVISLFLKTMKIERRGGLLIKNQERRRTAGGVFFYLLRGDPKYPKGLVDKIFQQDVQTQASNKKKEYANKRLRRKAKLQRENLNFEVEHGLRKDEPCDEVALQVNQECMEEDSDRSPDDPNESEVDSDEFYRIDEAHQAIAVDTSRGLVNYQAEDDCLDLHCDPTDLVYQ